MSFNGYIAYSVYFKHRQLFVR